MKTVLALGCFDFLHPGHIYHLEWARRQGDRLVVALTADSHVNKGPGRPHFTWAQRAWMLEQLRCVDEVVKNREPRESIMFVQPQIYVKGPDYVGKLTSEEVHACTKLGATILHSPTPTYSSTRILEALK